jgi:hypothetical protein
LNPKEKVMLKLLLCKNPDFIEVYSSTSDAEKPLPFEQILELYAAGWIPPEVAMKN